jgi:hypothetical protein
MGPAGQFDGHEASLREQIVLAGFIRCAYGFAVFGLQDPE